MNRSVIGVANATWTVVLTLSALLWLNPQMTAGAERIVSVSLNGVAKPGQDVVTVGDVATIKGGNLYLRRKIAALDLAKADPKREIRIPRRQVRTRILLGGFSPDDFHVVGESEVRLKPHDGKSREAKLIEFLLPEVAFRLGVDTQQVQLRLTRPLPEFPEMFAPQTRLEHYLPNTLRPGALNVKLGIYKEDRLLRTTVAALDIRQQAKVWVATRNLERNVPLTSADVQLQTRLLDRSQRELESIEPIGRVLNRRILAGQAIKQGDLSSPAPARKQIVVRARDIVEAVAKRRTLTVRVSGLIALDRGAVGDAIRVRNPDSDTVVTARVVSAGLVEVRR